MYGTGHFIANTGGASWTNPINAYGADEPSDDLAGTLVNAADGATSDDLQINSFNLLAEEGGPIPEGATITRVTGAFRWRIANSGGALDDYRGKLFFAMRTQAAAKLSVEAGGTTAAKTSSPITETVMDTGGTLAVPQTLFTRAELSNANFLMVAQGRTQSGLVGRSFPEVMWMRVVVEWVIFADRAGTATSNVVSAGVATAGSLSGGTASSASVATGAPKVTASTSGQAASTANATAAAGSRVTQTGSASASASASAAGTSRVTQGATATATATARGSTTLTATVPGGAASTAFATGTVSSTVTQTGTATATAYATGAAGSLVTNGATASAAAFAGGVVTATATASATATANAVATGIGRAFSFAIAGTTFDQFGGILSGVRVDVYRTVDHAHMGRTTSDAQGRFAVAIPNQPETFWHRDRLDGTPVRVATTDDDLTLIETQVQGPP